MNKAYIIYNMHKEGLSGGRCVCKCGSIIYLLRRIKETISHKEWIVSDKNNFNIIAECYKCNYISHGTIVSNIYYEKEDNE